MPMDQFLISTLGAISTLVAISNAGCTEWAVHEKDVCARGLSFRKQRMVKDVQVIVQELFVSIVLLQGGF